MFSESFSTSMFLETGSLSESGAHQFELDWPVHFRDLDISASSVWSYRCITCDQLLHGAGNAKPGPHCCREIPFPIESSSQHLGSLNSDFWNSLKGT